MSYDLSPSTTPLLQLLHCYFSIPTTVLLLLLYSFYSSNLTGAVWTYDNLPTLQLRPLIKVKEEG